MIKGSCLCGAVRYEATTLREKVVVCHCGQCRKAAGHQWAATRAQNDEINITGPIKWYRSSDIADRGFCPECGSSLFWRPLGGDHIAVGAGSVDTPGILKLTEHIFTADKGDYYDIADGLPQRED